MKTRPFTEAHAIAECEMVFSLSSTLGQSELDQLWDAFSRITIDGFEGEYLSDTSEQREGFPDVVFPGVPLLRFSQADREDGTPLLVLEIQAHIIRVSMMVYSGWEVSRDIGLTLLRAGRDEVKKLGALVNSCGLRIVDQFILDDPEAYSFTEVFKPAPVFFSPYLASVGNLWHSHNGWFETRPNGSRLLTHLNVQAQLDGGVHMTVIEHRIQTVPGPQELKEIADDNFGRYMDEMHAFNKTVLRNSLSPAMSKRIGLEE